MGVRIEVKAVFQVKPDTFYEPITTDFNEFIKKYRAHLQDSIIMISRAE